MRTIVTAGGKGADIDVFACAIAYAELLRLEGVEAIAVIPGAYTASVTPSILELQVVYQKAYEADGTEKFVLVDISDPNHFAPFVAQNRINEIYDHRYGYQDYWKERLGEHNHIEMVGSCGTLIWEQYKKRGKSDQISHESAKLLLASIVSNNLAMKSELTTERDLVAYEELKSLTGLTEEWITSYYLEQENSLLSNFKEYVIADTKKIETAYGDFVIGQLEIWDGDSFIEQHSESLGIIMEQYEPTPWFVNICVVSSGYNYLFSNNAEAKEILENSFNVKFVGNVAKTDKLLMRKYLMKVLQT
jgi:inorganic pyrophosphatase/exopolyphosphatase